MLMKPNEIRNVNPYSLDDLKKIHKIMINLINEDAGEFRKHDEGVFNKDKCIFVAPSPKLVPELMNNLFEYLKSAKDEIHPLVLSSIFHYEFVFIHPFSDGNGRVARLWQNIILTNFKDIFEYLPIETRIKKYQEEYYQAIAECNIDGNSKLLFYLC